MPASKSALTKQMVCNILFSETQSVERRMGIKKLIALVLALVMLAGMAMAEEIDLSEMSIEELITLKTRINELIGSEMITGRYVGGKDIKVGQYVITVVAVDKEDYPMYFIIRDADGEWITDLYPYLGETISIGVHENEMLEVGGGVAMVSVEEKKSWMP